MEEIFHWSEKSGSHEKKGRMALTALIMDGFADNVLESLKIAYPILVETSDLKDIKHLSVYHKDSCLYSYFEFLAENVETDLKNLHSSLKVEDELDWLPMKQVFHLD